MITALFGRGGFVNGSELLRRWVDDPAAGPADLDTAARLDEEAWREEREAVMLYR